LGLQPQNAGQAEGGEPRQASLQEGAAAADASDRARAEDI
jgi:hypothetical protein